MGNLRSLAVLLAISLGIFSAEPNAEELPLSPLLNPDNQDRLLLVAFSDSHIDRIQLSASPTVYRRRGPYRSSTWGREVTARIQERYGLVKLDEWPMTEIGLHCAVYLVPRDRSVDETTKLLSQDDEVDVVQRMHQFTTEGHRYNDPYYRLQLNMQEMDIEKAQERATGKDIIVALIDTGVELDHPDLAGQFKLTKNFVQPNSGEFQEDFHGTAVSGVIVARKDNQTGIVGVAPDAKIVALKACWPLQQKSFEAICNSFTLALALNTAIRLNVDVLNLSLAGPEDPLLERLLIKAREKGILVVAADPGAKEVDHRFPASLDGVIAVRTFGNAGDKGDRSEKTINAPGEHILTTLPHGTYDFVSGSSLAAAQVSGLIALMLELDPELKVDQAKALLRQASGEAQQSADHPILSSLNAGLAIRSLCAQIACPAREE